jgi:hypothetical protein
VGIVDAMSVRAGHDLLSSRAMDWLVALSDPLQRAPKPAQLLQPDDLDVMVEAASAHGVLPLVARNLRALAADHRTPVIAGPEAPRLIERVCAVLDERAVVLAGQSMLLLHHGRRIAAAMSRQSVPAAVVKGPAFADALYPAPPDRSFTDVDILIPHASRQASGAILQDLGFAAAPSPLGSGRDYGEYKFTLPENPLVLIEVQTDLIHSPSLRTGIRFQHSDLMAAGNGCSTDATALLMIAAVHGAAGHQFERMQPLVDVLQAVRGAAGQIDVDRLVRVARDTGSSAAIQTALDLAAALFNEPSARGLADAFRAAPWRRLRRWLVSPSVVMRSQSRNGSRDSWRRRALREIVRRIGTPGASAAT